MPLSLSQKALMLWATSSSKDDDRKLLPIK